MNLTTLYHPGLDRSVSVPASTARVLRRNGWTDADQPVDDTAPEADPTNLPDSGDANNVPLEED